MADGNRLRRLFCAVYWHEALRLFAGAGSRGNYGSVYIAEGFNPQDSDSQCTWIPILKIATVELFSCSDNLINILEISNLIP